MYSASLFFFNDTATTEIYTLSLHDALPILTWRRATAKSSGRPSTRRWTCSITSSRCNSSCPRSSSRRDAPTCGCATRSEEHTSELQSLAYLVCRLLLEKKKKQTLYKHTLNE